MSTMTTIPRNRKGTKVSDPVVEAANEIVAALTLHRKSASSWLKISQLVDRIPGLTSELAQAALKKIPSIKTIPKEQRPVVAIPSDPDSLVASVQELDLLCHDDVFFTLLVHRACSSESPVRTLAEIASPLTKELSKRVVEYWSAAHVSLPSGLARATVIVGKKAQPAIHDEQFPLPEVLLSRKLIEELEALQAEGPQSYPASLSEICIRVGVNVEDKMVLRTTTQSPFRDRTAIVQTPKDWIAFAEDVPGVVISEPFLQRLLQETCSREKPEVKLSEMAKQVPESWRNPFTEAWKLRCAEQRKLDFATLQSVGTKKRPDVAIRDLRFPPAEKVLAEQLVKVLISQKAIGAASYPITWNRLIELTDAAATKAIREKALETEPFLSQAIISIHGDSDAPVALTGDETLLAESPRLFVTLVNSFLTPENQAIELEKMLGHKQLHPVVKSRFQNGIRQRIAAKQLPAGIGALRIKKNWNLFRLSDVVLAECQNSSLPRDKEAAMSPTESDSSKFDREFEAVFARLDGKLGLPRYASLVDLRPALNQYSRDRFDEGLLALQQSGRYSLSVAEARFGLTDEERAACIAIDHVLHLLVHKN